MGNSLKPTILLLEQIVKSSDVSDVDRRHIKQCLRVLRKMRNGNKVSEQERNQAINTAIACSARYYLPSDG